MTTTTRLIRTAPGTVWKAWRNLPRWSSWNPAILEGRWLHGTPWEEGSTFEVVRRGPSGILRLLPGLGVRRYQGKVLSTAEEQLLVWELRPMQAAWLGPVTVESVRLEPAPGGTTVSYTIGSHGAGAGLLSSLLGGMLYDQAIAALDSLRQELAPPTR
jgi:hypothetical protein